METVYDWYFMATGWAVQETNDVKFNEPVQIVISTISNNAIVRLNLKGFRNFFIYLFIFLIEQANNLFDFIF